MAVGLCSVPHAFFVLQECLRISVHIDHVFAHGFFLNDVRDSLSRGTDPVSLGFSPSENVRLTGLSCPTPRICLCIRLLLHSFGAVPLADQARGSIKFGPTAARAVLHLTTGLSASE